jgi:hypothetical protein
MAQGAFQEGKLGMTIQHLARSPVRLLRAAAERPAAHSLTSLLLALLR